MFRQCRLSAPLRAEQAETQRSQTCSASCLILPLPLLLLLRKYNIRVEDIMVRDVRYITLNCCYRDLQNVLMVGHLKTLALVESAGETDSTPGELIHLSLALMPQATAQREARRRRVHLRRGSS